MSELNDQTHNITLYDELGNPVTIVNDDGVYRLSVDANVTGGIRISKFIPKNEADVSGITLSTSVDTELVAVTGAGKIDFIAIAGTNSNFEVAVEVDGNEVQRLSMTEIGSDLGLANGTNVPFWVETANKNFRFHPNEGVDFATSFKVIVKATTTPLPDVNFIVSYREEL